MGQAKTFGTFLEIGSQPLKKDANMENYYDIWSFSINISRTVLVTIFVYT